MAIAFMGGPAVFQVAGGLIVGAFPAPGGVAPATAYQALFGFLAVFVALACAVYARVPESRPSSGFAGA